MIAYHANARHALPKRASPTLSSSTVLMEWAISAELVARLLNSWLTLPWNRRVAPQTVL